ncbi:MAG: [FeFe] hydrogenase H-cluster radical SAM maturase HydG [bacterium]
MGKSIICEADIERQLLAGQGEDAGRIREILAKAALAQGLTDAEVAVLMEIRSPALAHELFQTASQVKDIIYGKRLVIFAPLYISNLCGNECLYCAFRARNTAIKRRALTQEEIAHEVKALVEQGHKRLLVVAGESYPREGFDYVLKAIETVYSVKSGRGEIRRVNANVAPLTIDEFKQLKAAKIGTYQLFQETYHRATYSRMHVAGRKKDFDWRVTGIDRAMTAGINDVGIGVLLGLCDWKFEVMALLQHIHHLEKEFGVGPHTISVPRLEPATGSDVSIQPPSPVTDDDFRKIVAILRLAVPYTGIIMSTRENAQMRREGFDLGISQISAGSRTDPGGYSTDSSGEVNGQFSLGDHRSLDEVIADVAALGYIPSFCTGCYRLGRTGADFMDMAKPGEIKSHCGPNAVSTFAEYLLDYASPVTREAGFQLIDKVIGDMTGVAKERSERLLKQVKEGKRDVYC